MEPRGVKELRLDPQRHPATGNTRHYIGGNLWEGGFSALEIVQYEDDDAYYLLYLDADGEPVTDTWHRSLEDALHQAEFEFSVTPEEWSDVP
jgi:hypothetical protein